MLGLELARLPVGCPGAVGEPTAGLVGPVGVGLGMPALEDGALLGGLGKVLDIEALFLQPTVV